MKNYGFSLVELSIVLVILGLLTGGILAGQNLIKAAELRSIGTQMEKVNTAMYTFRDKYFAMPGDMPNAFDFWGVTAACTDTVANNGNPNGCNGDGDGNIEEEVGGGEDLRAPQHLALAGLIEGSYTGIPAPSGNLRQLELNTIPSRVSTVGLWINYQQSGLGTRSGNVLTFAKEAGNYPLNHAFSPADQWNIDTKYDDGKPLEGRVTSLDVVAEEDCHNDINYLLTTNTIECRAIFWIGTY